MSTTRAARVGRPTLATYMRLFRPTPTGREAAAEASVGMMRHVGSRGYPFDDDRVRAVALEAWDRAGGSDASGHARQLAAILKSGDRTAEIRQITAPTLVVHGDDDPMVSPTGGSATCKAIHGARLLTMPGMGHDLPAGACQELAQAILRQVDAVEAHGNTRHG
jgi:pimeloyl-ACP methyl ester carboxylesterase